MVVYQLGLLVVHNRNWPRVILGNLKAQSEKIVPSVHRRKRRKGRTRKKIASKIENKKWAKLGKKMSLEKSHCPFTFLDQPLIFLNFHFQLEYNIRASSDKIIKNIINIVFLEDNRASALICNVLVHKTGVKQIGQNVKMDKVEGCTCTLGFVSMISHIFTYVWNIS